MWSSIVSGNKSPTGISPVSSKPITRALSSASYAHSSSGTNSPESTLGRNTSTMRSRLSVPTLTPEGQASGSGLGMRVDSATSSAASGRGFEVRFSAPVFDEIEDEESVDVGQDGAPSLVTSDGAFSYADMCKSPRDTDSTPSRGQQAYGKPPQYDSQRANGQYKDYYQRSVSDGRYGTPSAGTQVDYRRFHSDLTPNARGRGGRGGGGEASRSRGQGRGGYRGQGQSYHRRGGGGGGRGGNYGNSTYRDNWQRDGENFQYEPAARRSSDGANGDRHSNGRQGSQYR